jgi:uncharacterized protein YqjF (DUF2071 family)
VACDPKAASMITSFLQQFMSQRWEDLVMAHYQADPDLIQPSLPDDLFVDTHQGNAWFSVVAFRLTNLSIRPLTFLKWNDFWEINLRTYVCDQEGKKGVWFYSLDSSDLLGVFGARLLYGLRYNFARIQRKGSSTDRNLIYFGNRGKIASSRLEANWQDTENVQSTPGSLDHFLLERYRFWARRALALRSSSAFVRHIPYKAVRVQNCSYEGGLFASQGFAEPLQEPDLGHYCAGFTVEATAPEWAFSISGQANHR